MNYLRLINQDEIYSLLNMPPIKKKPKDFLSDFFELRDYWKNRQRALFLEYEKFSQLQHFIIKPLIITPFLKMLYLPEMKSRFNLSGFSFRLQYRNTNCLNSEYPQI